MNRKTALVTGAAGFIGSQVVKQLSENGLNVLAGIHDQYPSNIFNELKNVQTISLDILNKDSINKALDNVDFVYHFAALVNSHESMTNLIKINAEGTRNVWECAAKNKIKAALYCSSTAVYGMLSKSFQPVDEFVTPRAIEPYGYTKLLGETEALKIAQKEKLNTLIIRPVAVFGPNEHTPFGKKLREAAVSKILLAGKLQKRKFNYVHVDDVASASISLMNDKNNCGKIFNITVNTPVLFEDAFNTYLQSIDHFKNINIKTKTIALLSNAINNYPVDY